MATLRTCLLSLAGAALAAAAHAVPIVPPSIAGCPSAAPCFQNTANQTSPLGSNLTSPTDYTREYPFINHFKMARPWFSGTIGTFQDGRTLSKDAPSSRTISETGRLKYSPLFTATNVS